jgi:hypothetical protein
MAWDSVKRKVVKTCLTDERFIPVGKTSKALIQLTTNGTMVERLQAEIDLAAPVVTQKSQFIAKLK